MTRLAANMHAMSVPVSESVGWLTAIAHGPAEILWNLFKVLEQFVNAHLCEMLGVGVGAQCRQRRVDGLEIRHVVTLCIRAWCTRHMWCMCMAASMHTQKSCEHEYTLTTMW